VAGIPDNYLVTYKDAGAAYNFDWEILAAVGRVETNHGRLEPGCDESGAGARGPMQFMPATWDAYDVSWH
jgi:membrane-bound lytic murein transglycosylase B